MLVEPSGACKSGAASSGHDFVRDGDRVKEHKSAALRNYVSHALFSTNSRYEHSSESVVRAGDRLSMLGLGSCIYMR